TSSDAKTWVLSQSASFNTITFGNGIFVAAGNQLIDISADGRVFESSSATPSPIYGAAYGNGVFAVVGEKGTIFTSELHVPKFEGLRKTTDGTFDLTVSVPGSSVVEASMDLQKWIVIGTATNSTRPVLINDRWTNLPSRFYRARVTDH